MLAGLKPELELFDALSIDVALVHLFVIDVACLSKKESRFHYCGFRGFLLCMPMSGKGAVVEPLWRGCSLKCPLQIHALDKTALLPEGISIRTEPLLEEGSISEHQDFSKANDSVLIWFSSLMHFYVKGPKCSFNSSGPVGEAEVWLLSCFFQTSLHRAP